MTSFTKNYSGKKALEILKQRLLIDGFPIVIDLKKSRGSYIYNQANQKTYLDLYSFYATLPIGFNHPGLKNKAYQQALIETAQIKPALSDLYSPHYARFIDCFDRISLRKKFRYLFFIEGGALAVENALKVAFDWKTKCNFKKGIQVEADRIIHFEQCFHGRSGYTLSLTDSYDLRKTQYFPKFPWPRIPNPKVNVYAEELLATGVEEREKEAIGKIQAILRQFGSQTAAIIIEPVQSEGGGNHFRKEFLQKLRKIADANQVLLIIDEVQTGFGLSGKWWCFEHFGIQPDILVFGKKVQVCGIAVSNRIDKEGVDHCFKVSSRINSTFGGNLVDMVRATRYIEIIHEGNLLKNISKRGEELLQGLQKLSHTFPITNIRGLGGIISFDLPSEELRKELLQTAMEKEYLLLLAAGKRSMRFRPNLAITQKEVEEGIFRMERTLKRIFL